MGQYSVGEGKGANYIFGGKKGYSQEMMFELINKEVEIIGLWVGCEK